MRTLLALAISASLFSASAGAENIIRAAVPVVYKAIENWQPIAATFTEWTNSGAPKNCSNWSPDPAFIQEGLSFTQTATDCEQDQTRQRQEREQEATTQVIRNKGEAVTENRVITATATREAVGTDQTTPLSRYFTFIAGTVASQYGCNTQSMCMSRPAESNLNGKTATYMTLGYGYAINFGLSGYTGNQLKAVLTKLRVEMFDANGNKFYTLTQVAPFSNQYGNYVGKTHSPTDYANAGIAYKMRVSFELAE